MCDIYLKKLKEAKQKKMPVKIVLQIYRALSLSRANKNDLQAFTAVARFRAVPF